jgi:hypothetical protein
VGKDRFDLSPGNRFTQVDEEVRSAEIPIVFRNFIFENEMVPERIPGEFRNQAMILMQVQTLMREDEVGRDLCLQRLEEGFDVSADVLTTSELPTPSRKASALRRASWARSRSALRTTQLT